MHNIQLLFAGYKNSVPLHAAAYRLGWEPYQGENTEFYEKKVTVRCATIKPIQPLQYLLARARAFYPPPFALSAPYQYALPRNARTRFDEHCHGRRGPSSDVSVCLSYQLWHVLINLSSNQGSPRLTAPPKVRFERDLDSFLSSIAEIADKVNEKGSSLLDRGETLVKDKASTIGTAFDGTETLIAGTLDEVKSRALSAMSEFVTHISEPGDGGHDSDNSAASLDVQRSVGVAAAVLCAIFIGFIAT
ncbi:hypothetical protein NOF04DRAFT_1350600 [Fusarium oxysporum II5]|nr:hypothetical protein NOF04DRAFT_1350600 [Fusarium oxysporum II5]